MCPLLFVIYGCELKPRWGEFISMDNTIVVYGYLLNSGGKTQHRLLTVPHSADSSNELPDLHTTQTDAHASVVTEWPQACLHKYPWRTAKRQLNKTSNERPFQLFILSINICATNPIQFLSYIYIIIIIFCLCPWNSFIDKMMLVIGKPGSILVIKQT